MIAVIISAIVAIGVDILVSILTYFINKWLDKRFGK